MQITSNMSNSNNTTICEHLLLSIQDHVGTITLNRPQQLNALNDALMTELSHVLAEWDANSNVACVIITGNEKSFAAGADILEMADLTFSGAYGSDFITRNWEALRRFRKPVVAAVAGFAFGGGCELAMMCDIVIAAENAKFAQPEIKLGVLPGAGGTQRLPRAIGKAKAMDMVLTGCAINADQAERAGLVSRVVPLAQLQAEARTVALQIASQGHIANLAAKEAVNRAFESTLSDGVAFERRLFHAMFATEDQKEGMMAFVEKRKPTFRGL